MELKGSSVLITGASSGIGWETALAFGREGARVALAARRADKLEALARELRKAGAEALALACDVSDRLSVERAVGETAARFGSLDILVNNAGVLEFKRFEEQSIDSIEAVNRVNYLGVVYGIRAALPIMRRQGRGHIVNVASVAGLLGFPYMASYCASKFAVVGLTEALRRELYGSGITLTAFCPGSVDTPMTAGVLKESAIPSSLYAKTPRQAAERIVRASRRRSPEVIYGEAPGFVLRASKFLTRLSDWAIYAGFRKYHPLAR